LDIPEEDTEIYSDDENPEGKKIANKIVDYTLSKKKLTREKPGDSKRNRKDINILTILNQRKIIIKKNN
jgi:hypothetical protein